MATKTGSGRQSRRSSAPAKPGRPSKKTASVTQTICRRLSEGESLRSICRSPDMPAISTVMAWLTKDEEFSEHYARAREAQAETFADELKDIADNCEPESGAVQKAKLQIDARKWIAERILAKKYNPKQDDGKDDRINVIINGAFPK